MSARVGVCVFMHICVRVSVCVSSNECVKKTVGEIVWSFPSLHRVGVRPYSLKEVLADTGFIVRLAHSTVLSLLRTQFLGLDYCTHWGRHLSSITIWHEIWTNKMEYCYFIKHKNGLWLNMNTSINVFSVETRFSNKYIPWNDWSSCWQVCLWWSVGTG